DYRPHRPPSPLPHGGGEGRLRGQRPGARPARPSVAVPEDFPLPFSTRSIPMTTRTWIERRRFRPSLEKLEDRLVPALNLQFAVNVVNQTPFTLALQPAQGQNLTGTAPATIGPAGAHPATPAPSINPSGQVGDTLTYGIAGTSLSAPFTYQQSGTEQDNSTAYVDTSSITANRLPAALVVTRTYGGTGTEANPTVTFTFSMA